jgi:arginase
MGPEALRIAGLADALAALGHRPVDLGDAVPDAHRPAPGAGGARNAAGAAAWMRGIDRAAAAVPPGAAAVFMGGDHALAAASATWSARRARAAGRPLHLLWLDAHSDINTPATSPSGNLHGMPVAALLGDPAMGFLLDGVEAAPLAPQAVHMVGVRSVDPEERRALRARGIDVADMRALDERGTGRVIADILAEAAAADAVLHVSLDVDFLDPAIAPGVGTAVPGGASYREAHLAMEMLAESGRVAALDLVELNPFLDHAGMTARLLVELAASLFGRSILGPASASAGARTPRTQGEMA